MTAVSWKYNIDGLWSNAADWSGGAVPGAADDVTLATLSYHTITYASGSGTIHSLTAKTDSFTVSGGSLTILSTSNFAKNLTLSGGQLTLDGVSNTVAGTFTSTNSTLVLGNGAGLTLNGPAQLNNTTYNTASVEVDGAGTLTTNGLTTIASPSYYGYSFVLGGGIIWANTGVVDINTNIYTGDAAGLAATIVNGASGVFNFTSAGGIYNGSAIGPTGNSLNGSSTFSNAGTLENTSGNVVYIYSLFNNTGLVNAGTGTIEFDGGGNLGGTLAGAGEINLGSGNFTLSAAATNLTVANLTINGGAVTLTGPLNDASALDLSAGTLTLAAAANTAAGFGQTGGTLALGGETLGLSSGNLASGYLEGTGTLSLSGTTSLASSAYYVGGNAVVVNSGTVNQATQLYVDTSRTGGFSIVNQAGAIYALSDNSYIGNTTQYNPTFANAGLLTNNAPVYGSYIYAAFTNTGTVVATAGTLEFDGGGVFSGTLSGAGQIAFGNSASSTISAGTSLSVANLLVDGGTLTLGTALSAATNLAMTGGALLLSGPINAVGGFSDSGSTLYLNGTTFSVANGSFSGYGSLEGPGTFSASGTTTLAGVYLGGNADLVNTGTINQTGPIYEDTNSGTGASIVNMAGGTYTVSGGYYVFNTAQYGSVFQNAGLFSIQSSTPSYVYAAFTNTGTIAVTSGSSVEFDAGGSFGGTLTGAGEIAFGGGTSMLAASTVVNAAKIYVDGGTLALTSNETFSAGQFLQSGGEVNLNGHTLNVSNAALSGSGTISGGGTLALAGTTTQPSGPYVIEGGATIVNNGTFTASQGIYLDDGTNGGTLVNAASGTLTLGNAGIGYYNYTNESFVNSGKLIIAPGAGNTAFIYTGFVNTGTISLNNGTVALDQNGDMPTTLGGSVAGTGTLTIYPAGMNLAGLVAASTVTTQLYGGSGTSLSANSTFGGTFDMSASAINLNGYKLSLTGAFTDQNVYGTGLSFEGGGTLATAGTTTILDNGYPYAYSGYQELTIGGGVTWSNTGKVVLSGLMQMGDAGSSASSTLVNAAGAVFDLATNDASIVQGTYYTPNGTALPAPATLVNAGTFAKTAGTSTSIVNAVVNSTGTISSAGGTLALEEGGSLSGVIGGGAVLLAGAFTIGSLSFGNAAVLTNSGTVTDTGTLTLGGTAAARFNNTGTFDITGAASIVSGTATGSVFANTGTLAQLTTTGRNAIGTAITNTGSIAANSGTLALTGTVTGTGSLLVGNGATLELGGLVAATQGITFLGNAGTLLLDTPSTNAAEKINNFVVGDRIDLAGITATSATLSSTGTQIVLYNGSTATATLTVTGQHAGDVYSVASDGNSGSLLGITSNVAVFKNVTADWNGANAWNGGTPGASTNATVTGTTTSAFTLSVGASETVSASTLTLSAAKGNTVVNGTLQIGKQLSLSAGTLTLDGTLSGGTLASSGGTIVSAGGTLQNVVFDTNTMSLSQANAALSVAGTTSLVSTTGTGTIALTGAGATLHFDGMQILDQQLIDIGSNTGTSTLAATDTDGTGGLLILGAHATTVQTGLNAAFADSTGPYDGIFNEGSLTAAVKGGQFAVGGSYFENDGTIAVSNGDTLALNSASFVNAGSLSVLGGALTFGGAIENDGSITTSNTVLTFNGTVTTAQLLALDGTGDSIVINGEEFNAGSTLTVGAGTQLGTITGNGNYNYGTIQDSGGGLVMLGNGSNLDDLQYDGTLNLTQAGAGTGINGSFTMAGLNGTGAGTINLTGAGANLYFYDAETLNNAIVNIGSATLHVTDNNGPNALLTLGASTVLNDAGGGAIIIDNGDGALTNAGIINAGLSGSSLQIGQSTGYGTFTNQGSISVTSGDTLNINVLGMSNSGQITSSGGTLAVNAQSFATTGTISATNSALKFNTNVSIGGLVNVSGGTLTANALTVSAAGRIAGAGRIASTISDLGSITATGGTLTLAKAETGTGALQIAGSATLEIGTTVSSGQKITFLGSAGTLKLDTPNSFTGYIANLAGNAVSIPSTTITSTSTSGSLVMLGLATGTTLTLTVLGGLPAGSLVLSADKHTVYAYGQAAPTAHTPEPVAFGSHHVGDSVSTTLSIGNAAPATGTYEKLDASIGGATTGVTASGSFTGLTGGATDSTDLVVGLNTQTAGAVGGTATISLSSDGTGMDSTGVTPLGTQTVNVTGAVYAYAAPAESATTLNFGAARVGDIAPTQTLSISNGASATAYQENLDYGFASGTAFTAAAGTIAAGGSSVVTLSLGTGQSGDFTGTSLIESLVSDGTAINDGLGTTTLTAQTLTLNGQVFATAAAQLGTTSLNFGVVHVGDAGANTLASDSVTNIVTGALTDSLLGSISGIASGFSSTQGTLGAGLAAGASTNLQFQLATTTSGSYSGVGTLALSSHDSVLSDLALASSLITLTGTVDNYAVAAFAERSGGGVLSHSGTATSLNLGQIALNATAMSVGLEAMNAATGTADPLGGTLTASGSTAFTASGLGSFSGLGAGQADTAPVVTLATSTAGTFTETVTLTSAGSNASGYSGTLATQTFSITGTVVAPKTYVLTTTPVTISAGPANDVFLAASNTLVSGDNLNGGGGANILKLSGGGTFNVGTPAAITNIQSIYAYEGQAASGTLTSTIETLTLRAGLNATTTVFASTPASGNANPETINIYGDNGTDIVKLATGQDNVFLSSGSDTITLGGVANSITAGGGTALIQGTIANASASIVGNASSSTTLALSNAGSLVLNAADTYLTVKLVAGSNLSLGSLGFITANGAAGTDTIGAGAANQTLLGGAKDILNGSTAGTDTFTGASAALNGDTLGNWTTGDVIDITNMSSATLQALTYVAGANSGVLTVKSGAHTSAITFSSASLGLHNFTVMGSDGANGTLIGYHT